MAGPSLARDYQPGAQDASALPARAAAGDARAQSALARHADRLARGLAVVADILDPDAIVLGGGLSNMAHLYEELPRLMQRYVFSDTIRYARAAQPARRFLRRAGCGVAVARRVAA